MDRTLARNWTESLAAGLVGATVLTAVHQLARRITEDAPRMDVLGERAIARTIAAAGRPVPPEPRLHLWALAADLLANSAYYSLVTCGRNPGMWRRGLSLGLAAGAGALLLPRRLGLGDPPRADRTANQVMTVSWYLIGGLTAAAVGRQLRRAA